MAALLVSSSVWFLDARHVQLDEFVNQETDYKKAHLVNQHSYRLFILIAFCFPADLIAQDTSSWQKVRDEDGIQLYTAKIGDTAINKVKAIAVIDASLGRIVAVLNDVQRYPTWVPYLGEAKVLKRYSEDDLLVYSLFNAPWPVRDRDYVYRVQIDRQPNRVIYSMQTEQSELMPEQKHAVRAILIESRYELIALNDNQTRMELVFHTDPRGSLPVWIINIVHKAIPFDAVKGLRRQMKDNSKG